MFTLVRRFRLVAAFIGARRADYTELASLEWAEASHAFVRLMCGGVLALLSSLFLLGFVSVAVIVTAWDSDWRVLTAWLVAFAWLALGAAGGALAWSASRRLHPFERVRRELGKDLAVVRTAL